MTGYSNADWAKLSDPHYVYIAYRGDEAMYVGCTWNPAQRLAAHGRAPWIELVDRIDIFGTFDKGEALELERDAIWALQPTYNKRSKGRLNVAGEWADAAWSAIEGDFSAAVREVA